VTAEAVRTPEERFAGLPGYEFDTHYVEWEGLRLHYVDEGEGRPVVLFHGEPTWSFLYRKIIPILAEAGYRAVAPDYPGFGRSDKPVDPDWYTYDRHVTAMSALAEELDLEGATAVVQDWGGPIGLRTAVESPARFDRLSILNTGLFTGGGRIPEAFQVWRDFVRDNRDLPVAMIMGNAAVRRWDETVLAAYEAPFPTVDHKAGAWRFPLIVPLADEDPGAAEMAATRTALGEWTDPVQVLFSTGDPIFSTRTGQRWVDHIPGATELETIEDAGHFLQEDAGEEVGAALRDFLARTD